MTFLNYIFIVLSIVIFLSPKVNSQFVSYNDEYGNDSGIGVLGPVSQGKYVAVPFPNNIYYQWLHSGYFQAWVYLTSYSQNTTYIIHKGDSLNLSIGGEDVNHRPYFQRGSLKCTGLNPVPLNKWTHITATWIRDEGDVIGMIQVNGYPEDSRAMVTLDPLNSDSLTIGGSKFNPASSINGYIDEVRIGNHFIQSSERFTAIGGDPLANLNGAITSSNAYISLLASWSFNEVNSAITFDGIGGFNGYCRGGIELSHINNLSKSIPYNLALKLDGRAVRINHHNVFNRPASGTIDCWIYRDSFFVPNNPTILTKGNTEQTTTFRLYMSPSGNLGFQIGGGNTSSGTVPNRKWTHAAVTWKNEAGAYTIKFYINGKFRNQAVINSAMPLNADTAWIGGTIWQSGLGYMGYLDELRLWKTDLTAEEVKNNMFVSSKTRNTFQIQNLGVSWGFEGNLLSIGENGIFTNFTPEGITSRFSAYINEDDSGYASERFIAHPTAINRNIGGNVFPGEFTINTPDKNVPAGQTVTDTISMGNISPLNNIEVFLSYQHHSIGENMISLKAPNGQSRALLSSNGGDGNDVLAFFADGNNSLNSLFPPWSNIVTPSQSFGNFGGSGVQGNWIITITNSDASNAGKLLGWGIRVNNPTIGVDPVPGNIPDKFMLHQNYPNPFNPETKIKFSLPASSFVKLVIFDILGREIKTILNLQMKAGNYEADFDASLLAGGIYFYKLNAGSFTETKKMILIK
ncbi:MAG: T9SS type A sorting domain-containing protein [Ignavibacteria bacterium]|nr:T9SS type A sorting domain-containing protein [Ignavibacteria bacterium]